jgi:RES domain
VSRRSCPRPPADLADKKLTLLEFRESMFRTHRVNQLPFFFGCTGLNRFDSPDSSYNVLYAGLDAFCAFVETFASAAGTRIVTTTALKECALTEFKARRSLRLIDLTQSGALVRVGADGSLFTGDHAIPRLWSKALHDHPAKADGFLYPSRLDPVRHAVVLFGDRVPRSMTELGRESWYAPGPQRGRLVEIIQHYQLELIESHVVAGRKPVSRAVQTNLY